MKSEDRAGLYITVIVHLAVIIVLLLTQISSVRKGEQSFLIDFSREEAIEKALEEEKQKQEEEDFGNAVSRKVDELLGTASSTRNVIVDRAALRDDRGTDAEQLYKDAERLQNDLKGGFSVEDDEDYVPVASSTPRKQSPAKTYSGPSVVSYSLPGRKASHLPIPAYRCYGGGEVTVIITVDNAGNVVAAKVQDSTSSSDSCLRDFAVRAARLSKFSSDPKAPARQMGDIVYRFIAQ